MSDLRITRVANAGVLIEMGKVSILLDGICEDFYPYFGTPASIREKLEMDFPDIVAFTHKHPDHYSKTYADLYQKTTLRSVLGPESSLIEEFCGVKVHSVATRHIGRVDVMHVSFVIEGEKCIWFMGDASPLEIRKLSEFPKPDIMIVPYAFAVTAPAFKSVKALNPEKIVLLHMPDKANDENGLWDMVEETVGDDESVLIPDISETVCF